MKQDGVYKLTLMYILKKKKEKWDVKYMCVWSFNVFKCEPCKPCYFLVKTCYYFVWNFYSWKVTLLNVKVILLKSVFFGKNMLLFNYKNQGKKL